MTINNQRSQEAEHWEKVARHWSDKGYSNKLMAEHKRNTYRSLISRWTQITVKQSILKTDLFAEAFETEQILFDIKNACIVVGIDISSEVVRRAKQQAVSHGADDSRYICCDMRLLPLQNNSIDVIISDSSLDHFTSEDEIIIALKEFGRVLRAGGTIVLSIDNKSNITYPPYFLLRLWMKLGFAPYNIGKTLSLKKLNETLENNGLSIQESTAILHYPHPDFVVRLVESSLSKISGGRLDNAIRKGFILLEKLGEKRTKYITGRYLAVKAVKLSRLST